MLATVLATVRKDLRRTWPLLASLYSLLTLRVLVELSGLAYMSANGPRGGFAVPSTLHLRPLGYIGYLITLLAILASGWAVLDDPPAARHPLWATRPLSRWGLVVAKLGFVAVLVLLPMLLAQCAAALAVGVNSTRWLLLLAAESGLSQAILLGLAVLLAALAPSLRAWLGLWIVVYFGWGFSYSWFPARVGLARALGRAISGDPAAADALTTAQGAWATTVWIGSLILLGLVAWTLARQYRRKRLAVTLALLAVGGATITWIVPRFGDLTPRVRHRLEADWAPTVRPKVVAEMPLVPGVQRVGQGLRLSLDAVEVRDDGLALAMRVWWVEPEWRIPGMGTSGRTGSGGIPIIIHRFRRELGLCETTGISGPDDPVNPLVLPMRVMRHQPRWCVMRASRAPRGPGEGLWQSPPPAEWRAEASVLWIAPPDWKERYAFDLASEAEVLRDHLGEGWRVIAPRPAAL